MEITVTKKLTINTGNYSSISPSVSLSKDVKEEQIEEKSEALSTLCEILLIKNVTELLDLQESIKKHGPKTFIEELNNEMLVKETKRCINELMRI